MIQYLYQLIYIYKFKIWSLIQIKFIVDDIKSLSVDSSSQKIPSKKVFGPRDQSITLMEFYPSEKFYIIFCGNVFYFFFQRISNVAEETVY